MLQFLGLFYTGNKCPLGRWNPPSGSLDSILDAKDFRGILAITDVTVDDWYGGMARVTYHGADVVGSTPFRMGLFTWRSQGETTAAVYDLPTLDAQGNVVLRARWYFRIGPWLNRFTRWITLRWAPYVGFEIEYRIDRAGAEAEVRGTAIPSRTLYWDGQFCKAYDMNANSQVDIDAFMNAGNRHGWWTELLNGQRAPLKPGTQICP
jgi:hypothetical protein